jgi:hypothetical protein
MFIRHSFQEMHPRRARTTLEQLPEKLVHIGVEALVIDTVHFFAELVPMKIGIPYAHIWNVLHIDSSGATPSCLFGWDYEDTPRGEGHEHGSRQEDEFCVSTDSAGGTVLDRKPWVVC